jgi:hypothetical protein
VQAHRPQSVSAARIVAVVPAGLITTALALFWAGYGLRFLEIIGFCYGAAIILGMMLTIPYCEVCRAYMKTKRLPVLPASVKARKVKKTDIAGATAFEQEQRNAAASGAELLAQLSNAGTANDLQAVQIFIDTARPIARKARKLPRRISVGFVYCKKCFSAHLVPAVVTGQGKRMKPRNCHRCR